MHVAAEFSVADRLADGPRPVTDLAREAAAHPDRLHRSLRALASRGVFTETEPGVFANTPLSRTLRTGTGGSMRELVRLWNRDHYTAFGELVEAVRTGDSAFQHAFGTDWWSHIRAEPAESDVFYRAMGDLSRQIHLAALASCDLTGVAHLVDVGGGRGFLTAEVLRRHPGMRATVFDRPEVVPDARATLAEAGLGDRAEVVGGDFFDEVPPGADAYVLSMILHDWSDDKAARILGNIATAMPPHGRVIVIDSLLPDGDTPHPGKLVDITMMAIVDGRERDEDDFRRVFGQAGLRLHRTVATGWPTNVIEAVPA